MHRRGGARVSRGRSVALKVLYLINGLGTGGAERSLSELLRPVADAGITPIVARIYDRQEGVEELVRAAGFDVRELGGRGLPGRVRAVRRLLKEERPDLVHTTILESNLAGRLGAVRSGVPVLTSLVSILYTGGRTRDPNVARWKLGVARGVDGWTARRLTTHFHAISQAVKRAAVETMGIPADRITVVHRGRDPERLGRPSAERRAAARRHLGLAENDEVVLTVGRQEYPKGHRFLVEAAAELLPRRERLVVVLAGRRGHATEGIDGIAAPLGGRVRFLGHRDDVPDVMAAADVFAFPSLYEGLGGALIEAMGLGLPIVASDLEAVHEVVEEEENAFLVPPGDATALARAIEALLDDRARREAFGRASRQRFEERFTLDASASKMIELYGRVAASRGGGRGGAG